MAEPAAHTEVPAEHAPPAAFGVVTAPVVVALCITLVVLFLIWKKVPAAIGRSLDKKIEAIRLTGQMTQKNKLGFYYDYQSNCAGSALVNTGDGCRERGDDWIALGTTTTSPESANMWPEREKITQATWTSPATNRILMEAGFSSFSSKWGGYTPPGSQTGLVAVTEQSTAAGVPVPNFIYHGWNSAASPQQSQIRKAATCPPSMRQGT